MAKKLTTQMKGRPTKYDPSLPEKLLDIMDQGASKIEAAAKLKISRATLYNWASNHEEFAEALQTGTEWSEARNAEIIKAIALGQIPKANVAAYQMYMRNTAGWDKNQGEGTYNQTINIGSMNIMQNKSNDELLQFIQSTQEDLSDVIDITELVEIDAEAK